MTASDLTALGGIVVALLASVLVPLWVVRRGDARAAAERAAAAAAAELAGDTVSWESINRVIVRERDDLRTQLKEELARHDLALADLRQVLAREAGDIKARVDAELTRANEQIRLCRDEIDRLYRRLYGQDPPRMPP